MPASCGHHDLPISVALAAQLEPRERLGALGHAGKLVGEPVDLPLGAYPGATIERDELNVSTSDMGRCVTVPR
ncbi:MAG: hypothetical protein U0075_10695 [Thermomicrobiales bacterium]